MIETIDSAISQNQTPKEVFIYEPADVLPEQVLLGAEEGAGPDVHHGRHLQLKKNNFC
jgi:hypothetical protein